MNILATYNLKGGVGKTSSAVNLAYLAAEGGARTLVWDLDPQGAATYCFRIKPKVRGGGRKLIRGRRRLESLIRGTDYERLDLLPSDFSYRNLDLFLEHVRKPRKRFARLLGKLHDEYDYLFLDCAPSISLVSEAVFVASRALLVPTIPTTLSLRTLDRLRRHLKGKKRRRPLVLPFFCMVDRRKRLHRDVCAQGAESGSFLATAIPYASDVEQMAVRREPLAAFARGASIRAYRALWEEIRTRLEDGKEDAR